MVSAYGFCILPLHGSCLKVLTFWLEYVGFLCRSSVNSEFYFFSSLDAVSFFILPDVLNGFC